MKEITGNRPHAIFLPYPLQGHVIPAANLALKLASSGVTITFINTLFIHHQICNATCRRRHQQDDDHDIFAEARRSGLDIRYTTVTDGFPLEFDRSLNHDQFFEGIIHVFPAHLDHLIGKLIQNDPTINTFIVDTFYVWPSKIARKYNLVNVSFFTEPALVLTLYYHLNLLRKHGHFGSSENREDEIDYIPGVKSIKPTDLMSYLQAKIDINGTVHRILYAAFEDVKKADMILCNTVQEFEEETLAALRRKQPCYAIGPIFNTSSSVSITTSLWPETDCAAWLGGKPPGSVLYVSFGSYAHTTRRELEEIANGLSLSRVNFIWVLRPDIVGSGEADILPEGFQAEMEKSGRGLIVAWCGQKEVLSNPAVGGFLTHCGWNSILESVWCGVPMICYPLLTDQFTNRKVVVDDMRIGVNLCDGGSGRGSVAAEEVSRKVRWVLMGNMEMKERVRKVRKVLEDAVAGEEGSSVRNFNGFLGDLKDKIDEKSKQAS